jgi:hypothetical protein
LIATHVIPRPFEETERLLQHWKAGRHEQGPRIDSGST